MPRNDRLGLTLLARALALPRGARLPDDPIDLLTTPEGAPDDLDRPDHPGHHPADRPRRRRRPGPGPRR